MSILDIEVSCFKNYQEAENPKSVKFLQWLYSAKYSKEVMKLRSMKEKADRDKLKALLPAITPSGLFNRRNKHAIIKHSGFIQFDIDFKENQHIINYSDLKKQIANIVHVAYCGLSISGTGYWGLIPIAYPDQYKQHFESLEEDFGRWGIILDDKPKSIASLRGYSYDPSAYFNHQAITYTQLKKPIKKKLSTTKVRPVKVKENTKEQVEGLIQQICSHRIDLTADYNDWYSIGCALAHEFGEYGRGYFHQVSQFYSAYDSNQTDYQYTQCLKGQNFKINTFFYHCQQAGLFERSQNSTISKLPKGCYNDSLTLNNGVKVINLINQHGYPAFWDNPNAPYPITYQN